MAPFAPSGAQTTNYKLHSGINKLWIIDDRRAQQLHQAVRLILTAAAAAAACSLWVVVCSLKFCGSIRRGFVLGEEAFTTGCYRPSSAARPAKKHGPASRRPRPSAGSAHLSLSHNTNSRQPRFFVFVFCARSCCVYTKGARRVLFPLKRANIQ